MNVFLDLGSHKGKLIERFKKSKQYSKDFVIHAFECSPSLKEEVFKAYPKGVVIHRSAAWTCDSQLEFYVCPANPLSQGPSLIKEKTTGKLDTGKPVKVKCFDFSKWIKTKFKPDDYIVCKCNIEGAEYPVFDKMVADGTIGYIKKLYIRTHWQKINMPKEEHDAFMTRLKNAGIEIHTEYDF